MSRKTYTYKDELKARQITFILGVLWCIGMFIWCVFDYVDYDVDLALHALGAVFGPIFALLICIGLPIGMCVLLDKVKQLFARKFFRKTK